MLLATSVVLCGCAVTLDLEDALTVVPYDLQRGGRMLVDVQINDRGPFRFALDTAASISFVIDESRSELELETVPGRLATVHGAVATGRFPLVRIDRLQLGSEIWSGATLVSLPSETAAVSGIAGILGIDFLRRYGVGFSTQDRAVRLYPPDLVREKSYRGWADLPLEPVSIGAGSEPLYYFEVGIGSRTLPALFDLGAGLNTLNPPAARFLRLKAVGGGGELLSGALETAPILARLESSEVTTGGVRWRNEEFLIADLEIFETLMHKDSPLAILGSGLFSQRDFVIDFVRNRLLVRAAMDEVDEAP